MTNALRRQRDRFVAFSFAAADLLIETDNSGRITFATGAARRLAGLGAESLVGKTLEDAFGPSVQREFEKEAGSDRTDKRFGPFRLGLGKSRETQIYLSGCRLSSQADTVFLAISPAPDIDISGSRAKDLPDKEDFVQRAQDVIKKAEDEGKNLKVTLLDVGVVESLRALAGDEAVEEFLDRASRLISERAVDGAAGRIDEGRFGVAHDAEESVAEIRRDLEDAAQDVLPDNAQPEIQADSVPLEENLDPEMLNRALLYSVKQFAESKPGQFDLAQLANSVTPLMNDTVRRISVLRDDLARGRVAIWYQPVVNLVTYAISHHEALIRFDPAKSPYQTIVFAEQTGMIHTVDEVICESVIAKLRETAETGPSIAANVSGSSIQNDAFVEKFLALLDANADLNDRMLFEITESCEIDDLAKANKVLQEIRNRGFSACLDDFGAGAASIQYLRALEVDHVKLDGAYIQKLAENHRDRAIVKTIATLCADLGVTTIGEWVESEAQADLLRGLGVSMGQGYMFGRPSPELKVSPKPAEQERPAA